MISIVSVKTKENFHSVLKACSNYAGDMEKNNYAFIY